MRCAYKVATDAAERRLEAGEQEYLCSAEGDPSLAAADNQPATPNVAGARFHSHASSSTAPSAAGGSLMDVDLKL